MEIFQGYEIVSESSTSMTPTMTNSITHCDNGSWCNSSRTLQPNTTEFIAPDPPYNISITVILATLAAVTSFSTTVGNIMVVISFMMEKSIRQPSNYLIVSLAVTDILIGSLSMPLYTLYLLKNYWPLSEITCDLWLSLDYTVCLVSQYTVFLITLDRYCMVKVPARYRNWRTKAKIKAMIAVTWVVPAMIFFTSIMGWHYFAKSAARRAEGSCYAMFQENDAFSAILVICYYWVTLIIMIFLYVGIYRVALALHTKSRATKKRIKQLSQGSNKLEADGANKEKERLISEVATPGVTPSTNTDSSVESSKTTASPIITVSEPTESDTRMLPQTLSVSNSKTSTTLKLPNTVEEVESPVWKPRGSLPNTSIHWDAFTGHTYHTMDKLETASLHDESNQDNSRSPSLRKASRRTSKRRTRSDRSNRTAKLDYNDSSSETSDTDIKTQPKVIHHLSTLVSSLAPPTAKFRQTRKSASTQRKKSENRARKALRTITFILGAFVVCWTPYHVIVLVASFCKTCNVNETFYSFSYWLCYMNSPLNPFCYALSNPQFKKSFTKILKLQYMREWWQKMRHKY